MPSVCFYFQVHQPYRISKYTFFDIGTKHEYEDVDKNFQIIQKVSRKCYLPTNELILSLIERHKGKFKVAYSISGIALDQFERYAPEVIESFKKLSDTGCVEFLNETYYHSLAFLFSRTEFDEQVRLHKNKIKELFGQTPKVFRNTELIYNNELASHVEKMGYKAILAEGADHILGWRSPNFVYQPKGCYKIKLLLKNYRLSDDVAFRFSNRQWDGFPLLADKFAHWIHQINASGEVINLFMDYETFGEHQWEDTGIFTFMNMLPEKILTHPDFNFVTPSEESDHYDPVAQIDVEQFISWADIERDLTAWMGNAMQKEALERIYSLGQKVKKIKSPELVDTWRKLQTGDHFYYMCTKWFSDGDVHKYFNPFDSPYDAYINYMNILSDFSERLHN
jgi:alpha-amylase